MNKIGLEYDIKTLGINDKKLIINSVNQISRVNYNLVHFGLKKFSLASFEFKTVMKVVFHVHKLSCLADGKKLSLGAENPPRVISILFSSNEVFSTMTASFFLTPVSLR